MASISGARHYSTATLRKGRFRFNEVHYEQHPTTPDVVVLLGWDDDQGVFVWQVPGNVVAKRATKQHKKYSLAIPNVDPTNPPTWLGGITFIDKHDLISAGAWTILDGLAPHPKRTAIRKAVSMVRPDLVQPA